MTVHKGSCRHPSVMTAFCLGLFAIACGMLTMPQRADAAETLFVKSGETQYAYRAYGSGGAVPLVLITRYRANMDDWDPAFLKALSAKRQIIVFNQSGIASSSGSPKQTIARMAADVAAFQRVMGIKKADVLGWSMGGFTAQALVADFPKSLRRIVLVGTGPAASPKTPGPKDGVFDLATKAARADWITTYSDQDRQSLFFAATGHSREMARQSMARIDAARRSDEPPTTPEVMAAQTAAIQQWWFDQTNGYFAKMSGVVHPVLIINGDQDAFFTNSAQALMSETYPNAQLAIFPGAGHGPQHQNPEAVAAVIHRFLDQR